jgi:hypothetical protein
MILQSDVIVIRYIDSVVNKLQINTVKRLAIAWKTRVRLLPRAEYLLLTLYSAAVISFYAEILACLELCLYDPHLPFLYLSNLYSFSILDYMIVYLYFSLRMFCADVLTDIQGPFVDVCTVAFYSATYCQINYRFYDLFISYFNLIFWHKKHDCSLSNIKSY